MRGIIYVAGPMTLGDREENLAKGLNAAEYIWKLGFAPFVPHLAFFYNDYFSHTWEEWLNYDETIIKSCCAVYRIAGESKGADREESFARGEGIPVFYNHGTLILWAEDNYIQPTDAMRGVKSE